MAMAGLSRHILRGTTYSGNLKSTCALPLEVEEQIPICRRLLNHLRMQIIALRPASLVVRPRVDIACEPGLLVRVHAAELVQRESGGNRANGDVEAFLLQYEYSRQLFARAWSFRGRGAS